MNKRMIGQNKLEMSELGYGCMGLNHHRGPAKGPKGNDACRSSGLSTGDHNVRHRGSLRSVYK